MKKITGFVLLLIAFGVHAQTKEEVEVKKTIVSLFDKMQQGDSAGLRTLFDVEARIQTAWFNTKTGISKLETEPLDSFFAQVASIKTRNLKIEERMITCHIQTDHPLASAWVEYEFYINDKRSHKGVDAFQFIKSADGWKIIQLCDTRNKN